jgi:hypothetical protein
MKTPHASHPGAQVAAKQALRRNSDQLGPIRRGAGPRPEALHTVAIVVADTPMPSFKSSPWMRT